MPAHRSASRPRRDVPAYPLGEAAAYVRVAPATLRSWVFGRSYATLEGTRQFRALIRPADSRRRLLSFNNLVEAHVLRALRTDHGVAIAEVRKALAYAERELDIERLLLSRELCTDKASLFLDRYGQLINLSRSGQLAMRSVLEAHLRRIEWDADAFPIRLYPFVLGERGDGPRDIAIDPDIAFGRPVVRRKGVSTHVIVERIDAGEELEAVAEDYDLTAAEVEQAVMHQRAA